MQSGYVDCSNPHSPRGEHNAKEIAMPMIFKWIAFGLFIAALGTAIAGFLQFKRKRAGALAQMKRRRMEMMQEVEQIRSSSRGPLGSAK
jgi:hypothetical protein